jgi:hypothetical protein
MWWMKLFKENLNKFHFWSFSLLVILSWLRYFISGNLQVDDVTMGSLMGIAISILFVIFTFIHFMSFYYMDLSGSFKFKKALYLNAAGMFMLPCISNDIFSWLAYTDSFQFNSEIYRTSVSNKSMFYPYISELYETIPNVYGIICLIVAKMSIVSKSVLLNILSLKFFIAFIVSVLLFILNKQKSEEGSSWNYIFLNPLWTIHALGESHTEVLGLFFIFLAFYSLFYNRNVIAVALFSIAVLVKISFVLLFPVFVWCQWHRSIDKIQMIRFFLHALILGSAILILIFLLFKDFDILLLPLTTIDRLWPTGNFSDYFVSVYKLIFEDSERLIPSVKIVMKFLFLFYIGILLYINRNSSIKLRWLEALYFIFLAFLFLYSHRFLTWYLLILLPMFMWLKNNRLRNEFFFLSLFFTFQDVAHFNHLNYYHYVILIAGIVGSILFQVKSLSLPFFDRDKSHQ